MDGPALLLASGGVESTTLLHQLAGAGEQVQAVFIDYGQRAAPLERRAAEVHCEPLGVELVVLDLARVGATFRHGQDRKHHVPLPHRNLVALSLGLSYATSLGAAKLYLAVNHGDTLDYPSASHPFLAQFRLICGLLGGVELRTPYVSLGKAEIVRRGARLGVDYDTTYSCLLGYPVHCGRCAQCQKRRAAFGEAGVDERADFYRA
jgi:7-cyano-7-deazaguanine synthase